MVRLKEPTIIISPVYLFVSIPYGTIKSQTALNRAAAITQFQFLMVRLKACLSLRLIQSSIWFQFLMVRLKGRVELVFSISCEVSIPYGTIKR